MARHRKMVANIVANEGTYKGPTEAEATAEFKRKYEFGARKVSPRSPVSPWEHEYIENEDNHWYHTGEKERNLVKGAPSRFHGTKNQGKLRVSGSKSAHQLGKRR